MFSGAVYSEKLGFEIKHTYSVLGLFITAIHCVGEGAFLKPHSCT